MKLHSQTVRVKLCRQEKKTNIVNCKTKVSQLTKDTNKKEQFYYDMPKIQVKRST